MNKYHAATATLLVVLISCAGCASGTRGDIARQRVFARNLVFNPEWAHLPPEAPGRAAWPITQVHSGMSDSVMYRERIIDQQGLFGVQDDRLYRRVDTVRIRKR